MPFASKVAKSLSLYLDKWLPSGWRRSAILNIGIMSTVFLALLGILLASASSGNSFSQAWQLYTEDCRSNSPNYVSAILHLVINALSTMVLASSNFFMQVLNAPSREEVDRAHAKDEWLDIGIPSWRNAFRLSRFKTVAWLALLFTSIPIHMFFNSSVFRMDTRMGDFHVIIASETFAQGQPFFLPGASLMTEDAVSNKTTRDRPYTAYWTPLPARHYFNGNFSHQSTIVSDAAAQAKRWQRLESSKCRETYAEGSCSGLNDYRNVVIVLKGQGWKRSDVWNLSDTADETWEPVVPKSQTNSVWRSQDCSMRATSYGEVVGSNLPSCEGYCLELLTQPQIGKTWYAPLPAHEPWIFHVDEWHHRSFNSSLYAAPGNESQFGFRHDSPLFNIEAGSPLMEISHCLAEPRSSNCSVALSRPLFLAVVLSILFKVMICTVVIRVLGTQESLVTPGDAIASFISAQHSLYDAGLITQKFVRENKAVALYCALGPQRWVNNHRRQASAVPRPVWLGTYIILTLGIMMLTVVFRFQLKYWVPLQWGNLDSEAASSLLTGIGEQSPFASSVIAANAPQVYLSFWYLAYNSLLTRLEMSREWALFYGHYRPLRVTRPRGQQISTYHLQLPYKYSIILMILSTLMHWLMSNALFVTVFRGNYYTVLGKFAYDAASLPKDASVVVGTLSLPVLILIILGSLMVVFPIIVSGRKLPGLMPIVGSNSLALMAACRVSSFAKIPRLDDEENTSTDQEGTELEELVPESNRGTRNISETFDLPPDKNIALHLLKWGEVEMSEEWYRRVQWKCRTTHSFKPLGFGTTLDEPQTPEEGIWYV